MVKFKLWLEENQEIEVKEPYYRLVTNAMYGANNTPETEVGPGTYWTPRWDAILFMIRSFFLATSMHRIEGTYKIYKIDKAIMKPSPSEHQWAFRYGHDAGEMVLVKPLSIPRIIRQGKTEDLEDLVDQSFKHETPVDYSKNGVSANLSGQEIFISPSQNDIGVYKKNGWKFEKIQTIKSLPEWDRFESQITNIDWNSDAGVGLMYFFQDAGWIK